MLGGLLLTGLLFGNKPGAMHPAIFPFFIYVLISPLIAMLGTLIGLIFAAKKITTWKPFLYNIAYLFISLSIWVFLFIAGQNI